MRLSVLILHLFKNQGGGWVLVFVGSMHKRVDIKATPAASTNGVKSFLKKHTVFPHIVSAETIVFLFWKFKGHST